MASVELELRWQIAKAKAEERTYEQFVEEQIIDCMNDYLKDVKAKNTSIPIFSEAQGNGQSTLRVPSVKFQDSAIFSTISTTTSVTTPILVTVWSKEPSHYKRRNRRRQWDSQWHQAISRRMIKTIFTFKGNSENCQKWLLHNRSEVSYLAKSRLCSLEMWSYPSFTAAFEVLTESKVDNPKECLYFLDQHTRRKAKELIKGCLLTKNEDSYKVAKRLF